MELNWLQSLFLGLISGLTDIFPVSSRAHRMVFLKLFGEAGEPLLLRLMVHVAALAALYLSCHSHIIRMTRAQNLAKIPKNRRRRPLDTRSLSDMSLLKTALIPIVLAFFFYSKTKTMAENLVVIAGFLFLNGVILYIPQFLPGSNKDSGHLSRVEALLMGLGGAAATVPGISCMGTTVSIATACGMEGKHALNLSLLMNIPVTIGLIAFDFLDIFGGGMGSIGFGGVICCLLAGIGAFAGVILGIRLLRKIMEIFDFSVFGIYSWGAALFTFILYLTAA